jgi:hypothetical protein
MKNLAQLHEIPGSRRTKNQIEGDEWDKIYLSTANQNLCHFSNSGNVSFDGVS